MTYTPARGLRGDFAPGRGDLTGAKFLQQQEEKETREKAVRETTNAMRDGTPLVLVSIPGGRTFAIPRQIVQYLGADK